MSSPLFDDDAFEDDQFCLDCEENILDCDCDRNYREVICKACGELDLYGCPKTPANPSYSFRDDIFHPENDSD